VLVDTGKVSRCAQFTSTKSMKMNAVGEGAMAGVACAMK
jgi:hypothetical protein